MENRFPGGSWPVMLTPFTEDNKIDYDGLKELVDWYIKNGVSGMFAVCQSSEMFYLSLEERVKYAAKTVEFAAGVDRKLQKNSGKHGSKCSAWFL